MELYRKCMSFVQRTYSKAVLDGWNVNQFSFGHSRAYLKGWYYDDLQLCLQWHVSRDPGSGSPCPQKRAVGPIWPGNSWAVLFDLGPQITHCHLAWSVKLMYSPPTADYNSNQSCLPRKSGQRFLANVEFILQPCLGRALSQQSYPIVPGQWQHPLPYLKAWTLSWIDPNSKLYLPKEATSWPIQYPKLSWLVKGCHRQNEPIIPGRKDCLLKWADNNVGIQKGQKNQVNVTSLKETNKALIIYPKEMELY